MDNDYAGATATTSSYATTEAGGTVTLGVTLRAKPTADVTINIGATNAAEALVSPTSLVFTPDNYNVAQNVTVTGQDDAVDDGDVQYNVIVTSSESADPKFSAISSTLAYLRNLDND